MDIRIPFAFEWQINIALVEIENCLLFGCDFCYLEIICMTFTSTIPFEDWISIAIDSAKQIVYVIVESDLPTSSHICNLLFLGA